MSYGLDNQATVLALHWGFSIGGIAQYSTIIDNVDQYKPVCIHNVVVLKPGAHVDRETLSNLKSVSIIDMDSKMNFSVFSKIKKEISSINPVLVMTHGFNAHFIMSCIKLFMRVRVPAVCSYHGLYHATTPIRNIFGIVYNKFTVFYIKRYVVGVAAVADHCKKHLLSKGVPAEKIRVIHNGIEDRNEMDAQKREEIRQEWGIKDDEVLLGLASRLDPVKGLGYLLDAFVRVSQEHDKVKLVLIGTGTLEQELKNKVEKYNLGDRVVFTGFRSDVADCLHAIDIFMLPSLAEYHSIGLLEAMRSGKAIISTDVGGNTESVRNDKEAIVIPSASAQALEVAIEKMLLSPELVERLGSQARKRFLECFTINNTIKNTAEWFDKCIRSVT